MTEVITIELTPQEAQWLLAFIDCGLKANGVQVLNQAAALKGKLERAALASQTAEGKKD